MSYQKAMRHHNNPRKWKMTPARRRGNQLVFGVPATEKSTKEQPMSDTLQEEEDRQGYARWCEECRGYKHAPWCADYIDPDGEYEPKSPSVTAGNPYISEHQPAARGRGDEQSQLFPRYSFAVVTGRYKILDNRSDGSVRITQIANADGEDEARLIIQALNQHQSLVAERERLIVAAKATVERLSDLPRFLEKNCTLSLGRMVAECLADLAVAIPAEQRSTSE